MQSVFATTQLAERPAPFLDDENTAGFDEKKYLLKRREFYHKIVRELDHRSIEASESGTSRTRLIRQSLRRRSRERCDTARSDHSCVLRALPRTRYRHGTPVLRRGITDWNVWRERDSSVCAVPRTIRTGCSDRLLGSNAIVHECQSAGSGAKEPHEVG